MTSSVTKTLTILASPCGPSTIRVSTIRTMERHSYPLMKNKKGSTGGDSLRRREQLPAVPPGNGSIENLIVIGTSAGGHSALKEVLRNLPQDIPAALIILQHMWSTRFFRRSKIQP